MSLQIWNRAQKRMEEEKVYGGFLVDSLYGTGLGRLLSDRLLSKKWFSDAVGAYHSHSLSQSKVSGFIRDYAIPMLEYEEAAYRSFNDFFIRKFRAGLRPYPAALNELGSPAEGRVYAFASWDANTRLPVKGLDLSPLGVLERKDIAAEFEGGPVFLIRLCPVDYHWFHYPDAGTTLASYRLVGQYHSVNPSAVSQFPEVFCRNERHVSILETKQFGKLAYVEVGAMCVGRIVQAHSEKDPFSRGDAKGHFLFGGSTVIVFGQKGRLKVDADLVAKTAEGVESLVRLGEKVGTG